ncbi:hypothetical protein Q5424_17755 [Conexibacter sp. JD483]|uniref:hypothetical protein n=1 Tax=unclassified Conexibacter TaxID=2627773 RepID=UPI0027161E6A|nr:MULTISPECIES: hypothetical protein [unclassified Conexibacter]MDO8188731.1 hypothetical protein [Conexibacter sp. CPCC 205706]MDO8201258.1 hypothetical protein [Conexibacter sp. CPCC 205762]MDR9370946.1 hypothetical protein [Conexibacter sp. JD483]
MTRTPLAALAALALLLTFGAASAVAAPPPKFSVSLYVSSVEESNLEEGGYPDRCKSWTQGRSTLVYDIEADAPFTLGLVVSGLDDSVFALIPRGPVWMNDTRRFWKTRTHVGDNTSECSPCGPLSEYGLCTGALPDRVESDQCGGDRKTRGGALALTVSGSSMIVSGGPMADLSRCKAPRNGVVPMFSAQPKFTPMRIPGATKRLLRLKPGQQTRFQQKRRRGACDRLRGPGLRTCSEQVVIMRAKRLR